MEEDWEQLADSEKIPNLPKPNVNKWEGEDEEDDVKDSWEDDEADEEKKDQAEKVETPVKQKSKKSLAQKIAEKEAAKAEELARRQRERDEETMTPEEKLAEKLRLQKLAEENDLKVGLESLGLKDTSSAGTIDGRNPNTAEEFSELADAISKKVLQFKAREEFANFSEELVRNICASLSSNSIRKIKTTIDNMYLEKQKLEKGDKPKKGKGGKVKAKLRLEGDNAKLEAYDAYDGYDDFDDFM